MTFEERKAQVKSFLGKTLVIGIDRPVGYVHRCNDVEDKLVGAPAGMRFTKKEIEDKIRFQEQYYDTEVELL